MNYFQNSVSFEFKNIFELILDMEAKQVYILLTVSNIWSLPVFNRIFDPGCQPGLFLKLR